jgi:hypothetical protein
VAEDFEWGNADSPSGSEPPNWSMAPPPAGPTPAPVSPPPAPAEPVPPVGKGRRRTRTIRTVAIATVTAGALAIVGVSVASAQSSGPTTTPSTTAPSTTAPSTPKPGQGGPRRGPGGPGFGAFGGPGGLAGGGTIHGEYTRHSGTGYQTVDTQVGTVQAVSSTSIEVKSADGFDKKYVVSTNTVVNSGRDGIGSVKNGDTVQVEAVVNSTGSEASSIVDTTTLGGIRGHWQPAKPAAPSTPSTTTG